MKLRLMLLAIMILNAGFFNTSPRTALAQQQASAAEPSSGAALCLPDAYAQYSGSCLPLGPSQTLADLASQGITYPPTPLPGSKPPAEMAVNPINIARINVDKNEPVNVYATLSDAASGSNATRQIAPGVTRYVSYVQEERVDGEPYVMLRSGEWIRASPAGYPFFQGLAFHRTPTSAFGWMLDTVVPYQGPGYGQQQVGEPVYKWSVIQISEVREADGNEWYKIGPNQWVPWLKARRVRVNTTPPKGVTGDRWIEVNLFDQTLSVYENRTLVFATLVATGAEPLYTRPGLFQVFEKHDLYTMSGAFNADRSDYYYLEDVPWTMFFDEGRALHGAYWRAWFGYPGTHGCVNLSIGDSAWLYQWAKVGDWVYVWDPSGETPVDPSLYGPGGA